MPSPDEEWRPTRVPGRQVSILGRVRSARGGNRPAPPAGGWGVCRPSVSKAITPPRRPGPWRGRDPFLPGGRLRAAALVDLTGRTFGRLTVLGRADRPAGRVYWRCRCACGREAVVQGGHLTGGRVRSCGCLRGEANRARARHGETGTPLYRAWLRMKWRCSPAADGHRRRYAGRGVRVCPRWAASYEAFRGDIGPHPGGGRSLDRVDNDGIYEPGNCRWATRSEQNRNRRRKARPDPGETAADPVRRAG